MTFIKTIDLSRMQHAHVFEDDEDGQWIMIICSDIRVTLDADDIAKLAAIYTEEEE